uniref:Uncharacterized protein n=1 Tax=Pseudonaja textilis TaxID=8673 RepID=A0A670ZEI2_PSETE
MLPWKILLLDKQCGFQRAVFVRIMAWHQGLHNLIPDFNLHLNTEVQLQRLKRPQPITWGQVKSTTYQAQQELQQASLLQTPENLVAAVFAIITANSVTILLCIFLFMVNGIHS